MRCLQAVVCWLAVLAVPVPALAVSAASQPDVPPSGVIGMSDEAMLAPAYWIQQLSAPDRVLLDAAAIEAQNRKLYQLDPSMHDLRSLPASVSREQVLAWINGISQLPKRALFDEQGRRVEASALQGVVAQLALDRVPAQQALNYGLIVRRAALRSFPSDLRVFTTQGDVDIDRFQETAEFPGTPVAIVHASQDGHWLFVVSPRYAAWTRRENVAQGSAEQVFGYQQRMPRRIVTGAHVQTVYTREQPALSQLALDMGVSVPWLTDHAADQPVNGESPYAAQVIELPTRADDGSLRLSPALLPRQGDTMDGYLPLTEANILRQAFKFLGERYGWGHDYDARDCSGFVSDVYRSMGVQMPRDTGRQATSPALNHQTFAAGDDHETRMRAVRALNVGDLVYIPGHVMMVVGQRNGEPYVIHDTTGIAYRDGHGEVRRVKLNAVSVTPLLPLLLEDGRSYVDHMTGIVHIRP